MAKADFCNLSIQLSAFSYQLSAFSYQHSAISIQLSAFSYQHSAISIQLSAISYQLSAISTFHNYQVHRIFFLFPVPCSLFPVPFGIALTHSGFR
ncbi:hypothetical protein [Moorena sp. SIO3B2]|uniref:hypothetical protein n=1 Tax=Moorena sp. SIO3B2 TaxID=2607827 RepID=UPI0013CB2CF4|nr:hypothetical protein [Moorena sp. SIO3B2]NEP31047.1 hypothetical protein [Moorena sp. SIO3B2]